MSKLTFCLFLVVLASLANAQQQERIITAGSALTETVCALGDCGKIIASDRTSLYPANIPSLPSIGYRSSISSEGIISLKPTLLLAEKDYVDDAVLQQVKSTGIKVVIIKRAYSLDGTKNLIREIASQLNRKEDGEKLIKKIDSQLEETANILKKASGKPRVLCVYNRGTSSFDVAGSNTFADILPYVSAETAIKGINGFKPLNAEAIIASDPDYILFFDSGLKSVGGIEGALQVPGVAQTKAGKSKQLIAMDAIKLSNFGPRFGEAVRELAFLLHPEIKSE